MLAEAIDFLEVDTLPTNLATSKGVMLYLNKQDGTNVPGMYYTDGTGWVLFMRAANPQFAGSMKGPRYSEMVQKVTATAATTSIDLSAGSYIVLTLSVNTTVTFTNLPPDGTAAGFTLEVIYGGKTLAFAQTVKWPTKTAPTQTTAGTDVFAMFSRDGATFVGSLGMPNIG